MNRLAWIAVAACALALAAYAFWPRPGDDARLAFPDPPPKAFSITGDGGTQEVNDVRVHVAGLDRATDPAALRRLHQAMRIRVPAVRVLDGIDAAGAVHYGVDGSRWWQAGDERRTWGVAKDGTAAIHDPVRGLLFLTDNRTLRQLDEAAARLDQRTLLRLPAEPQHLTIDHQRLERSNGRWRFAGAARPEADGRVAALLGLLTQAQLASFTGTATGTVTSLAWEDGAATLTRDGQRLWLTAPGLPAQAIEDPAAWTTALAALADDRLADLPAPIEPLHIQVSDHGLPVLTLQQDGIRDADGVQPWRVTWPGGNEPAAADAAQRVVAAVRGLAVTQPSAYPAPPFGLRQIEITCEPPTPPITLAVGAELAWSGGWQGRPVTQPAWLLALQPADLLDHRPCPIPPARALKLQRRWSDRAEVLARRPGATWARTHPSPAVVDDDAVQRVVRALCRLRATRVRLPGAAEQAALAAPTFRLDVRFAPAVASRSAADDELALTDTVPSERGWACVREGEQWLMADQLGGPAFVVEAEAMEALMAPVDTDLLCPVAAGLVAAVEFGGAEAFRLERQGETWRLRQGDQTVAADPVAVRRLLRALGDLRSLGAAPPAIQPTLSIAVETVDGERIVLRGSADGPVIATATSSHRIDPQAFSRIAARKDWFAQPSR